MEIGFAHVNDKKIFLLNSVPEEVLYADEIKAMADVVIDSDLQKINQPISSTNHLPSKGG